MYQKNSQIITGVLPVKKSDLYRTTRSNKKKLNRLSSRLPIAAFLLLTALILFSSCDSSGTVGGDIGPGENSVDQTTVMLNNFETVDLNTFSGRLQRASLGYLEDPLYGDIQAVALLKPSISRASVDSIRDDATMSLKLHFSNAIYGDENAVSSYEIFEAGGIWRGNELKYNSEVPVDFSSKVGEFQVTDEDSIEVELSDIWLQKFKTFFHNPSFSRDSIYVNDFPGLAIVPAQTNQNIHYIRFSPDSEDETSITRFLVYSDAFAPDDDDDENGDDDNGNGDDDEEGPFSRALETRDWGSSMVRSNEPVSTDGFVLHNTERVLRVNADIPSDDLRGKNIVNASLVLTLRTDAEEAFPNIDRQPIETIRAHSFRIVPNDLVSELFVRNPRFFASMDEDSNRYRLDITQYVLNEIYGEDSEGPIFVSLQAINGFIYSGLFYDETASDTQRPRIVITFVE